MRVPFLGGRSGPGDDRPSYTRDEKTNPVLAFSYVTAGAEGMIILAGRSDIP
jgi:hypothetical protein